MISKAASVALILLEHNNLLSAEAGDELFDRVHLKNAVGKYRSQVLNKGTAIDVESLLKRPFQNKERVVAQLQHLEVDCSVVDACTLLNPRTQSLKRVVAVHPEKRTLHAVTTVMVHQAVGFDSQARLLLVILLFDMLSLRDSLLPDRI